MTLPVVCLCYHEMSKRLPRVFIPYYGYGPRLMSEYRRISIPTDNNDKHEFNNSNEADPPPEYESSEL